MEWLCNCGKPVTTLEVLWQWRDAAAIGHRHGRNVCYRCRIGCEECVYNHDDDDCQYFQLNLTAPTKEKLVLQILAEVLNNNPIGYLPRTDLRRTLRNVHKSP